MLLMFMKVDGMLLMFMKVDGMLLMFVMVCCAAIYVFYI